MKYIMSLSWTLDLVLAKNITEITKIRTRRKYNNGWECGENENLFS